MRPLERAASASSGVTADVIMRPAAVSQHGGARSLEDCGALASLLPHGMTHNMLCRDDLLVGTET